MSKFLKKCKNSKERSYTQNDTRKREQNISLFASTLKEIKMTHPNGKNKAYLLSIS